MRTTPTRDVQVDHGRADTTELGVDVDVVIVDDRPWPPLARALREQQPDAINIVTVARGARAPGLAWNLGARWGRAPVIAFVNPGATLKGPWVQTVRRSLATKKPAAPAVAIAGPPALTRFAATYDLNPAVSHHALFVVRGWWELHRGFDTSFATDAATAADLMRTARATASSILHLALSFTASASLITDPEDLRRYQAKHGLISS